MPFQVRRFSETFIKYEYKWCKSHSHFTFYYYILYFTLPSPPIPSHPIPSDCVYRVFESTGFLMFSLSYAFTYFHIAYNIQPSHCPPDSTPPTNGLRYTLSILGRPRYLYLFPKATAVFVSAIAIAKSQ